ncbi:MAG TPA: hypothetical protein VGN15_15000 [Ktedonobacteraceae bacterium]|nr:hypothetical protein [Ktedonobacteraceae bacterium]
MAADYQFLQASRKWLKQLDEARNGELLAGGELRSSSSNSTVPDKETPA